MQFYQQTVIYGLIIVKIIEPATILLNIGQICHAS